MEESILVFMAALPVYLIVLLGPILRRTGTLTPEMDKGIMSMAVHLFFPCLFLCCWWERWSMIWWVR